MGSSVRLPLHHDQHGNLSSWSLLPLPGPITTYVHTSKYSPFKLESKNLSYISFTIIDVDGQEGFPHQVVGKVSTISLFTFHISRFIKASLSLFLFIGFTSAWFRLNMNFCQVRDGRQGWVVWLTGRRHWCSHLMSIGQSQKPALFSWMVLQPPSRSLTLFHGCCLGGGMGNMLLWLYKWSRNLDAYTSNHSALDHFLHINATQHITTDGILIPTGQLTNLSDTALDFLQPREIGSKLNQTQDLCGTGCLGYVSSLSACVLNFIHGARMYVLDRRVSVVKSQGTWCMGGCVLSVGVTRIMRGFTILNVCQKKQRWKCGVSHQVSSKSWSAYTRKKV